MATENSSDMELATVIIMKILVTKIMVTIIEIVIIPKYKNSNYIIIQIIIVIII